MRHDHSPVKYGSAERDIKPTKGLKKDDHKDKLAHSLSKMPHDKLSALHSAVAEELSHRAKQHEKSKPMSRMSDREFEKFAREQIAQGEDQ